MLDLLHCGAWTCICWRVELLEENREVGAQSYSVPPDTPQRIHGAYRTQDPDMLSSIRNIANIAPPIGNTLLDHNRMEGPVIGRLDPESASHSDPSEAKTVVDTLVTGRFFMRGRRRPNGECSASKRGSALSEIFDTSPTVNKRSLRSSG